MSRQFRAANRDVEPSNRAWKADAVKVLQRACAAMASSSCHGARC
jgi:hypothetical protein